MPFFLTLTLNICKRVYIVSRFCELLRFNYGKKKLRLVAEQKNEL